MKEKKTEPKNKSLKQATLDKVKELIEAEEYDQALATLDEIDSQDDELVAKVGNLRGVIYIRKGLLREAELALIRAVKADPSLSEAFYNLGWVYQQQQDYSRALAFYKEAIMQIGDDAEIYELMALCTIAMDNPTDAVSFYNAALKLRPDSLNIAAGLAQLYIKLGDLNKATEILKIALISHPERSELHMTLGLIQKDQGLYENAIAHFRKVVMQDEYNSEAFNLLGECCMAIGLNKQAEPFFAKAAKLDPLNLKAISNLGALYFDKKNYEKAAIILQQWLKEYRDQLQLIDQGIEEQKDAVHFINMLGKSYQKLKNYDRARETFELSLQIDDDQPEIEKLMDKLESQSYKQVSFSLN